MVSRAGFTLIEMIFTIVIVAIIVAGVPRMIAQNNAALEDNLITEAIFIASAQASQTLSNQWDPASMVAGTDEYAKQLDISGITGPLSRLSGEGVLRIGNIAQEKHRRFHSSFTIPTETGLVVPDLNLSQREQFGYKDVYTQIVQTNHVTTGINTQVFPSFPAVGLSDMKMAVITIQSKNNSDLNVTLRVYAANIGEHDYAKRSF